MCNDSKEHEEECFVDKKYDINSVYKKYVTTELYAPLLVVLGRVGLGPNFSTCCGFGWVGSHEMDPRTTMACIARHCP